MYVYSFLVVSTHINYIIYRSDHNKYYITCIVMRVVVLEYNILIFMENFGHINYMMETEGN